MSRSRGSALLGRVLQRSSGAYACNPCALESSAALLRSAFSSTTSLVRPGIPAVLEQYRLTAVGTAQHVAASTAHACSLACLWCRRARIASQACCQQVFATRPLSGQPEGNRQPASTSRQQRRAEQAIVSQKQTFDEITDKHIPQRPMGVVEGTSYSLVILAAIGFGIALLWTAVSSLLIQPKEYTCFNVTLDKLRDDPRVTVRLGTPISGYGQESRNRAARQRIPHRAYKDDSGTEHIQVCCSCTV